MKITVTKRLSPVRNQSRYRVRNSRRCSRGPLLDECFHAAGVSRAWFTPFDWAFINAQALKPRAKTVTVTVEVK